MANFKTHFVVGASVGVVANLAKQAALKSIQPSRPFDWGELLAWGAWSGTIASLPDWLEPATNPHHRRFFHSFTLVLLILFMITKLPTLALKDDDRNLLELSGFAYLSHLSLDVVTPFGLPLFC